jgi:hypothetical protein
VANESQGPNVQKQGRNAGGVRCLMMVVVVVVVVVMRCC